MVVGAIKITLMLYACRSLKEKRSYVKKALARIRKRFEVSCAEVGENEKWQLTQLGFAITSNSETVCERVLDGIIKELEASHESEATRIERDYLYL